MATPGAVLRAAVDGVQQVVEADFPGLMLMRAV
jgi:hypothetical protein